MALKPQTMSDLSELRPLRRCRRPNLSGLGCHKARLSEPMCHTSVGQHEASTFVQAGPQPQREVPARAGLVLYGRRAGLCGGAAALACSLRPD